MAYFPLIVPGDDSDLTRFLQSELQKIAEEFEGSRDSLRFAKLYAAPSKPRDGQLVYADGTTWNPGSGAGLYQYRGSSWVFVG